MSEPSRLIFPAPTTAGTFDHYELSPKVEVANDYGTLPRAVMRLDEAPASEHASDPFWSIYGLTQGIATHLADRDTREEAEALLRGIGVLPATTLRQDLSCNLNDRL